MKDLLIKNIEKIIELGEGQFIEYKESFDKSLPKEIVAFANASGGFIYLGIEDSGNIKGTTISNRLKSQIQDMAHNCDPSIAISLSETKTVLIIEVKEGSNKPYSCSSGFFMRMGANSQKMTRDEVLALAIKSGKIRFDEQICSNFNWKDFDNDRFEYYLKLASISNTMAREDLLKNLRVLSSEGFTNAGVLFFAKEPFKYIISSKIRCVHFNDEKRIDILDKKVVDKGIIGNIEFAVEYLKERVPVRYEIKDIKRKEYPEYPVEAYREAIVNALIHFDYFLGDTIAIEKLNDKIIINNKGELLFPEKEFGKRSEARNRLMADLLSRTIYMEKAGTGIKRVTNACKANGNLCTFKFSDSVWLTIKSNKDVVKNVVKDVVKVVAKDREEKVIELIIENQTITANIIAQQLKINSRTVQRVLENLQKKNKIERVGGRKTGYWKIID